MERVALARDIDPTVSEISSSDQLGSSWTKIAIDWSAFELAERQYDPNYLATLQHTISQPKKTGIRVILTGYKVPR